MKIVCVYKSGPIYDIRYVAAMKTILDRYHKGEFTFYCLTDKIEEVKPYAIPIPLKYDYPKWFCKMELFDPSIFNDEETILYLDLDVVILKPINELLTLCEKHGIMPIMLRSADPVGWKYDWPSSSIMSWRGKQMHRVWYEWIRRGPEQIMYTDLKKHMTRAGQQTDQGFIRTVVNPPKFQDILGPEYFKFKCEYVENPGNKYVDTATILNWTGSPRLHEMGVGHARIRDIWRSRINILTNQD